MSLNDLISSRSVRMAWSFCVFVLCCMLCCRALKTGKFFFVGATRVVASGYGVTISSRLVSPPIQSQIRVHAEPSYLGFMIHLFFFRLRLSNSDISDTSRSSRYAPPPTHLQHLGFDMSFIVILKLSVKCEPAHLTYRSAKFQNC